jgi:hypothetical protein
MSDLSCNQTLPSFVPSACGINYRQVFANPTSRAARKAIKSPSLLSGQAQSTRIRTLKTCIAQVNTSEQAFNQVSRSNVLVNDTVTYQTTETQYNVAQQNPEYTDIYRNNLQPDLNIITFDPSGNLYSLTNFITSGINRLRVTKFSASDISNGILTPAITGGPTPIPISLPNTLVSANFFWLNNRPVFVGIFYSTVTYVYIYTFNSYLAGTSVSGATPLITLPNNKLYAGQSTYTSDGYIYIALASTSNIGFESSPLYYISPTWSVVTTNLQGSYISIQQCSGDEIGGVVFSSYSINGAYLSYAIGGRYYWRQLIVLNATLCAICVVNGRVYGIPGNYIIALIYVGGVLTLGSWSYDSFGATFIIGGIVELPMPNNITYTILSITMCVKEYSATNEPRLFYTAYLYNPDVPNFQYYVQNGEVNPKGVIVWSTNLQIGASYIISPTNTIQTNLNYLAVSAGLRLILYKSTFLDPFTAIVIRERQRFFCITYIVYPGCACPTLPVNNNPPLDSFTHTLNIAICQPVKFINPAASLGCAPVYTAPTPYLTEAEGAEPPQGPAVATVFRKYYRINGIDEICKPIPGRYGSTRTARIRTNIESASNTRYVNTVLPLVQYPTPCPVYGNQAGNPRAALCRPTIDGRPTGPV